MNADESNIGVIFGFICIALALLPWIPLDIWLYRHHHETISVEVREALHDQGYWGMGLCAFLGAVLAVGAYHFFVQTN